MSIICCIFLQWFKIKCSPNFAVDSEKHKINFQFFWGWKFNFLGVPNKSYPLIFTGPDGVYYWLLIFYSCLLQSLCLDRIQTTKNRAIRCIYKHKWDPFIALLISEYKRSFSEITCKLKLSTPLCYFISVMGMVKFRLVLIDLFF